MSAAWLAGRPCALEEAVAAAARLLDAARLPLVYGLAQSTVEAQREAVRLARAARALIDPASTGPEAHLAFARLGFTTASLGEIRRRADFIVFWACDPDATHPGFVERYAPAREGRARLAVDVGEARGPEAADTRVNLAAERELEALLVLRAFVRGRRVEPEMVERSGIDLPPLRELATRLKSCRYAAVLYDGDPQEARRDPERAGALVSMALDARPKAIVRLLAVRAANSVGAETVLTWLAGASAAVSFAQGQPRFGPREWSGEAALASGEVDAALLVGGASASRHLSRGAREQLGRSPTVWIGADDTQSTEASVVIATAAFAATPGSVFRMDGVAVRQDPKDDPTGRPTEASVLARIAAAVEERSAARGRE